MAEFVGSFAASHTPVMLNFPNAVGDAVRERVYTAFKELGAAIAVSRPDILVLVSDDHLHNFFLDNFPAFCIGAGNRYPAPAEHWLKAPAVELAGDAGFGAHLLGEALNADFDPSFSMHLTLDHGVLTPLMLAGLGEQLKIVPLLINCVQPPLPTMRRCLKWGRMLRAAIDSYPGDERIAVLATGGVSHDVATPRMGMVNEPFDREFLSLLERGQEEPLARFATDHVNEAGNGAEEIRNWLVAHGAAGGRGFHNRFYEAVPSWYTGIALGSWSTQR
ncbi:2,3-dihydroxyphenylpropionate 1,2-dioxygenase [Pseudorhodoferax sp. Leaf265]|uniref:DODA-type extradiol aromatic ring-opening family dioxygenase n=1 Tax=Pseudorhodoferax sp. Leaf265 TaxID=1736315 RepID=UPI0006F79C30|nr:2,3-dihydroxyphenylpropionate 1,2-dioxygenase [Pseudorhodoferax sp. Leaf265]KQP04227.1 2,3-dihydroxyphenylpropionate 1,2-dioxygenase [Pseudorhodoferax sp. Leaf265]